MANLKKSNATHKRLATLNSQKWLRARSRKEINKYGQKRSYHESVEFSQNQCGRVLTSDERKRVFDAVKKNDGNVVQCYFPK